jgi:hypothetical protein
MVLFFGGRYGPPKKKRKKRTIKGYGSAAKGEDTFIYQLWAHVGHEYSHM